jgi:hypothetical protein
VSDLDFEFFFVINYFFSKTETINPSDHYDSHSDHVNLAVINNENEGEIFFW